MFSLEQSNWIMTKRALLLLAAGIFTTIQAQDQEETRTRQLWDTTLMSKRPSSGKSSVTKSPPVPPVDGALVGITVWRSRSGTRALVMEGGSSGSAGQATLERVRSDTALAEGEKVRISTEAAQRGYLYVIDRDEYADGSRSDPYLIFPTLRTRGGDNHVAPGIVVEIPSSEDNPPYFTVQRSRDDQINELLTFLITPKPLAELKIAKDRLKLGENQVSSWEKKWKAKSYKLEDAKHEGQVHTVAEKEAARGSRSLTKDDPLPQTMYHVDCKAGDPVLLEVPLKILK